MPCADPLTVAHAASSPNRSYSLVISGPCAGARKDLELFDCHARTGGQAAEKLRTAPHTSSIMCSPHVDSPAAPCGSTGLPVVRPKGCSPGDVTLREGFAGDRPGVLPEQFTVDGRRRPGEQRPALLQPLPVVDGIQGAVIAPAAGQDLLEGRV